MCASEAIGCGECSPHPESRFDKMRGLGYTPSIEKLLLLP